MRYDINGIIKAFIKASFSFYFVMGFIAISTFATFVIPICLKWKMVILGSIDSPPVLAALQTYQYQTALVVSASVSAPMYIELLLRLLNSKLKFVLPNAVMLTSLAIPDLMILCFVRVFLDLNVLNCMLRARFVLFYWLALISIKKYGGDRWSHKWLVTAFALACIARITAFYKPYFTNSVNSTLSLLGAISDSISFVILIILSFRWYRYIFREFKFVSPTTDQYMCNVYVTATLITCIGMFTNTYTSPSTPDWYNWNASQLTTYSIFLTLFYVIVMVFEGRILQNEMLQTKVRHYIVNLILIIIYVDDA